MVYSSLQAKRLKSEIPELKNKPENKCQHTNQSNVPVSLFQCDYCSFITKYKYSLCRHIHTKHLETEKNRVYECDNCGRIYTVLNSFLNHKYNAHKVPQVCGGCGLQPNPNISYRNIWLNAMVNNIT